MSRVVRLWWGKTQDGAQVQNWAQVVVYGFFVFEKWATLSAESYSNMVGKNPRWCSSSNLDPSSNSWFFSSWKVNCFQCWELFIYGWKKPKLALGSNNKLGFFSTFKTKQFLVLRIAQLWCKKAWTATWVQNWTHLIDWVFCCLQYLAKNVFWLSDLGILWINWCCSRWSL